jgi:hypothetical protein
MDNMKKIFVTLFLFLNFFAYGQTLTFEALERQLYKNLYDTSIQLFDYEKEFTFNSSYWILVGKVQMIDQTLEFLKTFEDYVPCEPSKSFEGHKEQIFH